MALGVRALESAAIRGAILMMVAGPCVACSCAPQLITTGGLIGAILGTMLVTLLIVAVVLVLVWFFCLRQRLRPRANVGGAQVQDVNDGLRYSVNVDTPDARVAGGANVNVDVEAPGTGLRPNSTSSIGVGAPQMKEQAWGMPKIFRRYLNTHDIPAKSIKATRVDDAPDYLDFDIARHGVALFVKGTKENSPLSHINDMAEGMQIVGMSVVFDDWDVHDAVRFIAAAAPYKPHLYMRQDTLFDVDELTSVGVSKSGLSRSSPVPVPATADACCQWLVGDLGLSAHPRVDSTSSLESEVAAETAHAVRAAPPTLHRSREASVSGPDIDSIAVSDEDPREIASSMRMWTFDRSGEVQPERVVSVRCPSSSESSSDTCVRSQSWADGEADGEVERMTRGDIYRATPVSLVDEEPLGLNFEAGPDMAHHDCHMEDASEVSPAMSQPSHTSETRLEVPRVASSLESYAIDSGLGSSANVGLNGAPGSSDASQDGRNGLLAYMDHSTQPTALKYAVDVNSSVNAEMSEQQLTSASVSQASSRPSSVAEAPIECTENPRKGVMAAPTGLEHLEELSELDRKIALNNIEIATLMLNDSHDRQLIAIRDHRISDSEVESAEEEPITPTTREEVKSGRFMRHLHSGVSDDEARSRDDNGRDGGGLRNHYAYEQNDASDEASSCDLAGVPDEELSNVITRLAESSDSEAELRVHGGTQNLMYEADETYA